MSVLRDALAFCERPAGLAALSVALKMHSYTAAGLHVLGSPTPSLRQFGEQGLQEMLTGDASCGPEDAAQVIRELLCLLEEHPSELPEGQQPVTRRVAAPPTPVQASPQSPEAQSPEAQSPEAQISAPVAPGLPAPAGLPTPPTPDGLPAIDLTYMSVLQMITALNKSGLKVTYDELNQVREGRNKELARKVLPLIHAHRLRLDALPGSRFAHARAQLQHAVFSLFDLDCPDALAPLCLSHGLPEYPAFADLCPPELLRTVIGEKTTLQHPESEPAPALLTPEALCALENLAAVLLHSGHLLQVAHISQQLLAGGWNEDGLDRCLSAGGNAHLSLKAVLADKLSPDETAGAFQLLRDLLQEPRTEPLSGEQQQEAVRKGRHALRQTRMPVDINDLAGMLRVRVSQLTLLVAEMGAVRNGREVTLLPTETRGRA